MTKYIKRHDSMKRLWHWSNIISCVFLAVTGAFLFIPGLGEVLGFDTLRAGQVIHRVFAGVFIGMTVISFILRPSNLIHSMQHIFAPWDEDDKKFMKVFFPYLFNPKKYHMPKQHFVKSGQRVSDFFMYLIIFFISITGIILWAGDAVPTWLFALALFGHDLCFFGFSLLIIIHIYLGGGIFEPYHRIPGLMLGKGYVRESDALYHWGHWAEEELASGENVIEVEPGEKVPFAK